MQPNLDNLTELIEQNNFQYIGENVQIGSGFGGMKPVAQNGTVLIVDNILALYDTNGQLLDQAKLSQIKIKSVKATLGATVFVYFDDRRFSVSVGHGKYMVGEAVAPLPTLTLGSSMSQTKQFAKTVDELKKQA